MSPNIVLLSAVIGMIALIFSIFGAQWLNQRAMERQFGQFEKRLDARFVAIEQRIANVEQRLDRLEHQIDAIFKAFLPSPK